MKILYIANVRLPTEKAHGWAVMKMCEALALQDIKLELVVPWRSNSIEEDEFKFYSVRKNFKLRKIPCLDLTRWGKTGFFIQWISFSLFSAVYATMYKADCYYGRDELSLWFISFFKKGRIVWEAHTAKSNWLVKSLLNRIQSIVVISNGLKEHFIRMTKNSALSVLVAPSGFDSDLFNSITDSKEVLRKKFNIPLDKTIIAYVGKLQTMGESKGVEQLEEAFKIIETKHDNIELIVVSEVLPADVPLYMKASDVLVMNYPNTKHYANYMSPLKLFEYMASGNSIITSDLPTIREIVDESMVTFFKAGDLTSLASAVSYLIENPEEARNKSLRSLAAVKQYSWQDRAEKVRKFIYEIQ